MAPSRRDFDARASQLVGKIIRAVSYYELDYGPDHIAWDLGEIHSLDFGVDLRFDADSSHVTWSGAFFQYGVEVVPGSLADILNEVRTWDVTRHPCWLHTLGHPISSARYWWAWLDYADERIEYPQDLELSFSNGATAIFSASEYREQRMISFADHVSVVFSERDAQRFGFGRFMPDEWRA